MTGYSQQRMARKLHLFDHELEIVMRDTNDTSDLALPSQEDD
jgi:hypothetical protein